MGACNICGESDNATRGGKLRNTEPSVSGYGSDGYNEDQIIVGSRSASSIEDQLLGHPIMYTRKEKPVDPTLDGVLNYPKMADFSAMLPPHVKKKLWNGVFKLESDYKRSGTSKIKQILKVFVMLHLTRIYKKQSTGVPQQLKDKLTNALEIPSEFIKQFLKQRGDKISRKFSTINRMLIAKCARGANKPGANQSKYAKHAQRIEDNFVELQSKKVQREFNEQDFVRPAFLQYLLCAFAYETQGWKTQIPFDLEWLNQMKGRDAILVRGYLRRSGILLFTKQEPFTAVTLFYFHHLYFPKI